MSGNTREPMLDMFIFETVGQIERLEQLLMICEQESSFDSSINEIFRIMHTIKGSAAMMLFDSIATLAHSLEDLFYYLREKKPPVFDHSLLADLVLEGIDYVKAEIVKIDDGQPVTDAPDYLIKKIQEFLSALKGNQPDNGTVDPAPAPTRQIYYINPESPGPRLQNMFKSTVYFEAGCEMENVRAFLVIHNLKDITADLVHFPEDIMENDESSVLIRDNGFKLLFRTDKAKEEIELLILSTAFVRDLDIESADESDWIIPGESPASESAREAPIEIILEDEESVKPLLSVPAEPGKEPVTSSRKQSLISVNVNKLDILMDLVGELIISESMVTQNPELMGIQLDSFHKASRQLRKITHDLQDLVMSIRMVPLAATFQRMNRLIRDMSKKIQKEIQLQLIGEDTEVDKNIIEHIADPLMHVVRNSVDHGIGTPEERRAAGKPEKGTIVIEATTEGGDVWIIVRDDGRGMDREKILNKAKAQGLLTRAEHEYTDREVFAFVFLPGFSTKEAVTEFSGRGVGMDVAVKDLEKIGGTVIIDSTPGVGTTVNLKIPLTLGIIDGMTIQVGNARFTVPMTSIKESFRVVAKDLITDPDGNEMIMVRGVCLPVLRLRKFYELQSGLMEMEEGIIVIVEHNERAICLFADALLGEQQVVIKPLPEYIKRIRTRVRGIAGCALLGDGGISLIMDIPGLLD